MENHEGKIKPAENLPTYRDVLDVLNKTREEAVIMAEELGKKFSQEQLVPVIKDAIIRMLGNGDFGWPKFALELFTFVELDNDIRNAAKRVLLEKIDNPPDVEWEIFRIMRWYDIPENYLQTKKVQDKAKKVIINLLKRGDESFASLVAFEEFKFTKEEYDELKREAKS